MGNLQSTAKALFGPSAAVVGAVVGAAAQAQFQTTWAPWARWLVLVTIGLALVAAVVALALGIYRMWRAWSQERGIEKAIRDEVAAAVDSLSAATGQGFAMGVGCILNPLNSAGQLSPELVNVYVLHLNTLAMAARNLSTDLKAQRLLPTAGLARLVELHRDYSRICVGVSTSVVPAKRDDIQRDWEAIRDAANSMSQRLLRLDQIVRAKRNERSPAAYFENVPR